MKKNKSNVIDELLSTITPEEQAKADAKMLLAAKITDAMKAKGWKNKDLLKAMGKNNPSEITKWLSGTHNFTVETLVDLEIVLSVKLLNLLDPKEETVARYHTQVKGSAAGYKERHCVNDLILVKNIELVETCINAPRKQLAENTLFQFDINLEHRIGIHGDIIYVICSVSVLDEGKDQTFGKIKAGCIFEVKDLSQFLDEKTKRYNLPEPLIITLNSISISTIRGVMFAFYRGTYLHNAVLPIIDPKELSRASG